MIKALDVNGNELHPKDRALLLATPKLAMRFSQHTNEKLSSSWIFKPATVLKLASANRTIVQVEEAASQPPLFEIDSVMLEKIV